MRCFLDLPGEVAVHYSMPPEVPVVKFELLRHKFEVILCVLLAAAILLLLPLGYTPELEAQRQSALRRR